jgi:hypothetical protein
MKTLVAILVPLTLLAVLVRCYPGVAEGDRCNPSLSFDECDNAPTVACAPPTNCLEAYCCSPTSKEQNCQPCAGPDASAE